jgi:hypothetical protein
MMKKGFAGPCQTYASENERAVLEGPMGGWPVTKFFTRKNALPSFARHSSKDQQMTQ